MIKPSEWYLLISLIFLLGCSHTHTTDCYWLPSAEHSSDIEDYSCDEKTDWWWEKG